MLILHYNTGISTLCFVLLNTGTGASLRKECVDDESMLVGSILLGKSELRKKSVFVLCV